jgi:hypothetical protein
MSLEGLLREADFRNGSQDMLGTSLGAGDAAQILAIYSTRPMAADRAAAVGKPPSASAELPSQQVSALLGPTER